MVKFGDLVKKKRTVDFKDLIKLFESLDRQSSHTELRPAQMQALQMLTDRRIEADLILKISTGAGKTTVALLYLQSHMEAREEPAVYLCPTIQLVQQVLEEATKLGISAYDYPGSEPHPHQDCLAGKAITVCTYDKLFNAKSTFNRDDVRLRPCAIVLDDAHAGVEEIRNSFTLHLSERDLYEKICQVLQPACEKFKPSAWSSVRAGDPTELIEVPYWVWKSLVGAIHKLIQKQSELKPKREDETRDDKNLKFVWPYLQNYFRWCRCIVSGNSIEFVPEVLPVHQIEAYCTAKHRLFMSATLADDSTLVRELDCSKAAAEKPILPEADKGLGERMVLAPSLVDKVLNRVWVMKWCESLAKRIRVVVLSPSETAARAWEPYGGKVVLGDAVSKAIAALKDNTSKENFFVFVQRYDGVDLPDKSCRVLVIDGLPVGEGITDKLDSRMNTVAGGVRNRLIYRIEQGMGRAVRSHVDYAVVILAGPEIGHFIAKREVLNAMNPDTKAQLELALDLATIAGRETETTPEKALMGMLVQCLAREADWKQYYDERVRGPSKSGGRVTDAHLLNLADAERQAFNAATANDLPKAVKILSVAISENIKDEKDKARYLQKQANYLYDLTPGDALELQRAAHEKCRNTFCPPGVVRRVPIPGKFDTEDRILRWVKDFENPNGAVAALQDLRARLSYDGEPTTVEQALMDLAEVIGADGSRPEDETGRGPDDMWLWPELSLVIEAKNNEGTLYKKDAGQMLGSLQWFGQNYKARGKPVPVVAAKIARADKASDFPKDTRVLTADKMATLLNTLDGFVQALVAKSLTSLTVKEVNALLGQHGLLPEQFLGRFTVSLD